MLLETQHFSCRIALEKKEMPEHISPAIIRAMFYDPTWVFQRVSDKGMGSNFKRTNTMFMDVLFPQTSSLHCACGGLLTGRQKRWFNTDCRKFAMYVYYTLVGASQWYSTLVYCYNRGMGNYYACSKCGVADVFTDMFQIDHIIPVWAGGGLCWLSNLTVLCIDCHKEKTKSDRKIY